MSESSTQETSQIQQSASNQLQKVAVGRLLLSSMKTNHAQFVEAFEMHDADYRTKRTGLLYLPEETVGRYAGKTILGKQHLQDAIDQISSDSDSGLNIIRRTITLYPINRRSTKADYYNVSALMDRAFDERGATTIPKYEKKMLERVFGISNIAPNSIPKIKFGTLVLPYGSPDKNAFEEIFNDLYPKNLRVDKVQILDQR